MRSVELRKQRAKLIEDARAIDKKATAEKRSLTAEERGNFDKALADAEELMKDVERFEKLESEERALALATGTTIAGGEGEDAEEAEERSEFTARELAFLDKFAERAAIAQNERRASGRQSDFERRYQPYEAADRERRGRMVKAKVDERAAFGRYLRGGLAALSEVERRALEATDATQGGSLVSPISFQRDLIKFIDDTVYLRSLGTVRTLVGAKSIGFPSLDADPADADWTSEIGTGSEDSSMRTGGREMAPHALAKRIKVSNKLLNLDASAESLVRDRLAYKFGVSMEKAGLTGDGSGKPLGIFVANAAGISSARNVTATATQVITSDLLFNVKYALKGQYQARASWLLHRDAVKMIAKLRDGSGGAGTGQYLWQPSIQMGQPDVLLGRPVLQSEFVPNTFTTGLFVGMFGDFSYYWWVDALGMTLQRLNELYAETNQTGFIGRLESDGMPVLEEAFARMTVD